MIKQNAGPSGSVPFSPQCQLATHSNTLTATYGTAPGISQEATNHLHRHSIGRTANLGTAVVSQSTETEVTSAIGGSIVTPAVTHQNRTFDRTMSDLLSINEMSQDDGKLMQ